MRFFRQPGPIGVGEQPPAGPWFVATAQMTFGDRYCRAFAAWACLRFEAFGGYRRRRADFDADQDILDMKRFDTDPS